MSTCPNSDLYSALVDGEVPSPWKEKLEAHLTHCTFCREKVKRYRALSSAMNKEAYTPSPEFLSKSLAKVESIIECKNKRNLELQNRTKNEAFWKNTSIRMPIPLFAALFLAAIFIPTFFTRKATEKMYTTREIANANHSTINTLSYGTASQEIINTATSVYSPDLPERTIASYLTTTSDEDLFTMINFARKFATNKDLFSDAEIIIIKLPNLTQFSNTGENSFYVSKPLQQAAGYYK